MGLCTSIECTCAIESSTLTVTGDGSPASPWNIDSDPTIFAFDTYADLPNPAAFPDLSGILVREASEMVIVRDGAYALPGTVFVQLFGTPSVTAISGSINVNFTVNAFSPVLPLVVAGGGLRMRQYFHPAEIAIRGIGFLSRTENVFLDWVEIASAASAAGDGPFRFISDAQIWQESSSETQIVPVFGQAKPAPEAVGAAPLVIEGVGATFSFRARSFGGNLNSGMYIWATLAWNTFNYQGQL